MIIHYKIKSNIISPNINKVIVITQIPICKEKGKEKKIHIKWYTNNIICCFKNLNLSKTTPMSWTNNIHTTTFSKTNCPNYILFSNPRLLQLQQLRTLNFHFNYTVTRRVKITHFFTFSHWRRILRHTNRYQMISNYRRNWIQIFRNLRSNMRYLVQIQN